MTGRLATVTMARALRDRAGFRGAPGRARRRHRARPQANGSSLIDSDVHVLADGSLRVQETIRIRSAGQMFKHGLEREFPQTYAGPLGSRAEVGFRIEEVLLDGAPEQFTLRRWGSDAVLRAGRARRAAAIRASTPTASPM